MTLKYVDDMKKNRFSIFYEYFPVDAVLFQFDHKSGQSVYRGSMILTVTVLDNAQFADITSGKSINTFEVSAGNLNNTGTFVDMFGSSGGLLQSELLMYNGNLCIHLLNDGDIRDVRLDVEFLMPDDDYMIYVGTA